MRPRFSKASVNRFYQHSVLTALFLSRYLSTLIDTWLWVWPLPILTAIKRSFWGASANGGKERLIHLFTSPVVCRPFVAYLLRSPPRKEPPPDRRLSPSWMEGLYQLIKPLTRSQSDCYLLPLLIVENQAQINADPKRSCVVLNSASEPRHFPDQFHLQNVATCNWQARLGWSGRKRCRSVKISLL